MSDYYKIMYKKLIKEGKMYKIQTTSRVLFVLSVLFFIFFVSEVVNSNNSNNWNILVFLFISAVLFFFSQRATIETAKRNVELSRNLEISEKNLDILISEIEKSIKESLATMKWGFGLISTFVLLANTLYWNGFFQSVIKVAGEDEIKDLVDINNFFLILNLVLIFGGLVLFAYFILTLLTVKKKSMLYLLYNVRYSYNEKIEKGVL